MYGFQFDSMPFELLDVEWPDFPIGIFAKYSLSVLRYPSTALYDFKPAIFFPSLIVGEKTFAVLYFSVNSANVILSDRSASSLYEVNRSHFSDRYS